MKKLLLCAGAFVFTMGVSAQSMFEDFESYSVGDYMGVASAAWTTWSGSTGGAEDVKVTNTMASSGTQSIYFSSTSPSGGPQDVVVPFGGAYNTGQFFFETDLYVESGKGAYFNFQAETVIGSVWAFNMQCVQDGNVYFDDGTSLWLQTTYPSDTWFTLTIDINLNTNDWEILIDGVSQGVYQNEVNQIASLDLYPVNGNWGGNDISGFYCDDVEYLYTPYSLPSVNGGVTQIKDLNGLSTQTITPTVKVRNLGTTTITSFDLEVTYDGTTLTENVTGVSIASTDYYEVPFTGSLTLVPGVNDVVATISNVNGGGADDDAADDSKTVTINPVVPAPGKVVVGEEGTGTWCQWCPRGAVFMDLMEERYSGFWAGIAVHNGDPMTVDAYDAALGALIGGYPSALVDRGADIDPSDMEADFLNRVVIAPTASITPGAYYIESTNQLAVSLTVDFLMDATGSDYNLAFVLTEDSVTGTGSGWSQANAYASGSAGEMGGYELLPNPVPASQMVYDHVARAIMPGFGGQGGLFPSSVSASDSFVKTYLLDIDPSEIDIEKTHIIGLFINNSTDEIDNAGIASFEEAVTNGYVGIDEETPMTSFDVYPNPATDVVTVNLGEINGETLVVSVYDMNGKLITKKNYGVIDGAYQLPIYTNNFEAGIYNVSIQVGDQLSVEKLIVK